MLHSGKNYESIIKHIFNYKEVHNGILWQLI